MSSLKSCSDNPPTKIWFCTSQPKTLLHVFQHYWTHLMVVWEGCHGVQDLNLDMGIWELIPPNSVQNLTMRAIQHIHPCNIYSWKNHHPLCLCLMAVRAHEKAAALHGNSHLRYSRRDDSHVTTAFSFPSAHELKRHNHIKNSLRYRVHKDSLPKNEHTINWEIS